MAAAYSFVSQWRLAVPPHRAWDELVRALQPGAGPSWWPGFTVPMPPRDVRVGERAIAAVRSPFGYRLQMLLEITEVDPGRAIAAHSDGDLRGSGRVEVRGAGDEASLIEFSWEVETRRAWMNATVLLLRPVFEYAHARVMRRGERGLHALLGGRSELRNAGNPRFPRGPAVGRG